MADTNNTDNRGPALNGPPRDNDVNAQISGKLRELYDSVREEAIPDRFLDLLEKLDEAEQNSKLAVKK
ncbi:NepR family anti-sigma factor [Nisaea sediminum]|uniref:NepR family anti-sigma factor n=1 Tax=Nisaea sediminum TaxID=2775867 RepID=UPI0018686C88|nr:NepR family anti-sigma factor [Nisaea sediminum]